VSRFFLSALLAIALLFVGSVAAIWWFTGGDAPDGAVATRPASPAEPVGVAEAAPPSVAPAAALVPPAPAAQGSAGAAPAPSPVVPAAAPPRPSAPAVSVQGSTPAARRRALTAFRREFQAGLRSLDAKVAHCAPGGVGLSAGPSLAETSFTLTVETAGGGVRIADVQVEERGRAGEAELACAVAALRGEFIPSSSAVPGSRWQTSYAPSAQ
jgi:hypothetical protein